MPHPLLHVLECKACIDQQAGTAVAKLVQADMGHTVLFQKGRKFAGDIVRRVGTAVGPFEYVIALLILPAE